MKGFTLYLFFYRLLLSFFKHLRFICSPFYLGTQIKLLTVIELFILIPLTMSIALTLPVNAFSLSSQHTLTNSPFKFDHLTLSDGLSQSYVFSIKQDGDGFIWIATEDGLNRYDGKNFVHYRHDGNDPTSIIDNIIRTIFIDNNGMMWVGTDNGLSLYNKTTDSFENFQRNSNTNSLKDNVIWSIYQDNKNNILVATQSGLHQFNPVTKNFIFIKINGITEQLKEITTIFQDKKNNYWLGTYDHGVYILNENLSYAVSLKEQNKWDLQLEASGIFDIKLIENEYWLATNNGLYIISQNYKINKHLTKNNHNALLSNKIRSLEQIDDSNVWLATPKGLNSINLSNYTITAHQRSAKNNTLSENWLMDIFKDNIGNVWIGTYGGGVSKFNPISNLLLHTRNNNDDSSFVIESIIEILSILSLAEGFKILNFPWSIGVSICLEVFQLSFVIANPFDNPPAIPFRESTIKMDRTLFTGLKGLGFLLQVSPKSFE